MSSYSAAPDVSEKLHAVRTYDQELYLPGPVMTRLNVFPAESAPLQVSLRSKDLLVLVDHVVDPKLDPESFSPDTHKRMQVLAPRYNCSELTKIPKRGVQAPDVLTDLAKLCAAAPHIYPLEPFYEALATLVAESPGDTEWRTTDAFWRNLGEVVPERTQADEVVSYENYLESLRGRKDENVSKMLEEWFRVRSFYASHNFRVASEIRVQRAGDGYRDVQNYDRSFIFTWLRPMAAHSSTIGT